jgi:hypothetical protein
MDVRIIPVKRSPARKTASTRVAKSEVENLAADSYSGQFCRRIVHFLIPRYRMIHSRMYAEQCSR